jgi:hypothetical protein
MRSAAVLVCLSAALVATVTALKPDECEGMLVEEVIYVCKGD